MAELKKVWIIRDVGREFDIFDPEFWGRGGIPDEETLLYQFGYDSDGVTIDHMVNIVKGTMGNDWWTENTKVYDDATSAKKDATKRLERARKRHERGMTAANVDHFKTRKANSNRGFFAAVDQFKEAVIRKEKGKGYCVKSPNNPNWDGGCYPSKDEAEKRLQEVEYFKHNK